MMDSTFDKLSFLRKERAVSHVLCSLILIYIGRKDNFSEERHLKIFMANMISGCSLIGKTLWEKKERMVSHNGVKSLSLYSSYKHQIAWLSLELRPGLKDERNKTSSLNILTQYIPESLVNFTCKLKRSIIKAL